MCMFTRSDIVSGPYTCDVGTARCVSYSQPIIRKVEEAAKAMNYGTARPQCGWYKSEKLVQQASNTATTLCNDAWIQTYQDNSNQRTGKCILGKQFGDKCKFAARRLILVTSDIFALFKFSLFQALLKLKTSTFLVVLSKRTFFL